jgi:uncharacterized membrane protein
MLPRNQLYCIDGESGFSRDFMKRIIKALSAIPSYQKILAAMVIYCGLFSYFAIMKHLASPHGDPDLGLFGQGFWTTYRYGAIFHNTFESGTHFRVHFSPNFFLILPFYAIYPSIVTLLILGTIALASGAWPVYLLARERLSENTALCFSFLYLLYHPLHGMNYDPWSELCFAVAPLLWAVYFFQKRRWGWFWICILLVLSAKEEMGFLVTFWGLYGLGIAIMNRRKKDYASDRHLIFNSSMLIVLGIVFEFALLYYFFPWVRKGVKFMFFADRYAYMGESLGQVLLTMITRPWIPIASILNWEKIGYLLELFFPLAFLSLPGISLIFPALPTLMANLLSTFGAMHNTGMRYVAPLIPFIFASAITGLARILEKAPPEKRLEQERAWISAAFICTLLLSLTVDMSPFSLLRPVECITSHQVLIHEAAKQIPDDVPVSTQIGLYQHVVRRMDIFCDYREGVEYIFLDRTCHWFYDKGWNQIIPELQRKGSYDVLMDSDGVLLMRRKKG